MKCDEMRQERVVPDHFRRFPRAGCAPFLRSRAAKVRGRSATSGPPKHNQDVLCPLRGSIELGPACLPSINSGRGLGHTLLTSLIREDAGAGPPQGHCRPKSNTLDFGPICIWIEPAPASSRMRDVKKVCPGSGVFATEIYSQSRAIRAARASHSAQRVSGRFVWAPQSRATGV